MIRISDVRKVGVAAGRVGAQPKAAVKKAAAAIADASPTAVALDHLVADAVKAGATTVHVEPEDGKHIAVRYRVDGLLRAGKDVVAQPELFVRRIKKLAHLDTQESRVPQDGSFTAAVGGAPWTIRVTILPVADGEKAVLHLANQSAPPHTLQKLGFWGQGLHAITDNAERMRGLVLVGGPAGSGCTATMYGMVQLIDNKIYNVMAIEDHIEQRLPGINQTPVMPHVGMTFESALRAALRQDPNVVMLGELAEPETTALALQAALAGRLVVAGMHAHDVAASVAHVVAMRTEPYVVASTLKIAINQRLARRLCADCREPHKLPTDEFNSVCQALGLHGTAARAHVDSLRQDAVKDLAVSQPNKTAFWRAKEGGCAACGGSGYKGRVVIAEVLVVSPAVQKLLLVGAGGAALYDQAMQDGMVPLPLDGLVKASLGLTSIEELLRVISE